MLFRLKDIYNRARLHATLRDVLRTPPARLEAQASFSLLSQIREKDVLMYVLAVKSFCRWHQPNKVIVLVDGKLGYRAVQTLCDHIPGIVIEPHTKYRNKHCPSGGTWERLLALVTHSADSFILQLDADTVTLGRLGKVEDCIKSGRAFTLGSLQGRRVESGAVACQRAKQSNAGGDSHIQTLCESTLDQFVVPGREIKYVRGCSGFSGIPKRAVTLNEAVVWAQSLGELVGHRWVEWGTEQFMSNLIISNIEDSVVLPHPEYATCPNIDEEQTLLAHFAGFCRFANKNQYARLACTVIDSL